MNKKKDIYKILSIVFILDQIIKLLIMNLIKENQIISIIPKFFSLTYVKNTGAAFGIMSGNIIILVIVTLILLFYIIKEVKNNVDNKWILLSYLLILSGAIGNLIDRIFRGYVVDFISFTLFIKWLLK